MALTYLNSRTGDSKAMSDSLSCSFLVEVHCMKWKGAELMTSVLCTSVYAGGGRPEGGLQ